MEINGLLSTNDRRAGANVKTLALNSSPCRTAPARGQAGPGGRIVLPARCAAAPGQAVCGRRPGGATWPAVLRPVRQGNAFEETVERLLTVIKLGMVAPTASGSRPSASSPPSSASAG